MSHNNQFPSLAIDLRVALSESLSELIIHKERELDHELSPANKKFLQETLTETCLIGISKYIRGSMEHGDNFLQEVDHLGELFKENIDSIFYGRAAMLKQHKHSDQYKS